MIRYQITDGTAHLDEEQWFRGLRDDVDFIQIRERVLTASHLARLVRRALTLGPKILVNDRADAAIATGASGVHLRSNSVCPALLRRITRPGFIITIALHKGENVSPAADYALLAPIFKPLSKEDEREPLGLRGLQQIATESPIPVIALGGITEANARLCLDAGASGIAGITLFRS